MLEVQKPTQDPFVPIVPSNSIPSVPININNNAHSDQINAATQPDPVNANNNVQMAQSTPITSQVSSTATSAPAPNMLDILKPAPDPLQTNPLANNAAPSNAPQNVETFMPEPIEDITKIARDKEIHEMNDSLHEAHMNEVEENRIADYKKITDQLDKSMERIDEKLSHPAPLPEVPAPTPVTLAPDHFLRKQPDPIDPVDALCDKIVPPMKYDPAPLPAPSLAEVTDPNHLANVASDMFSHVDTNHKEVQLRSVIHQ